MHNSARKDKTARRSCRYTPGRDHPVNPELIPLTGLAKRRPVALPALLAALVVIGEPRETSPLGSCGEVSAGTANTVATHSLGRYRIHPFPEQSRDAHHSCFASCIALVCPDPDRCRGAGDLAANVCLQPCQNPTQASAPIQTAAHPLITLLSSWGNYWDVQLLQAPIRRVRMSILRFAEWRARQCEFSWPRPHMTEEGHTASPYSFVVCFPCQAAGPVTTAERDSTTL